MLASCFNKKEEADNKGKTWKPQYLVHPARRHARNRANRQLSYCDPNLLPFSWVLSAEEGIQRQGVG